MCLGREVLHLCVCVHRWVCAPSSALTQVSWDRGPEHSSEPSAAFSSLHTAGIQGREGPCLPTWPWRAAVCVVGAESPSWGCPESSWGDLSCCLDGPQRWQGAHPTSQWTKSLGRAGKMPDLSPIAALSAGQAGESNTGPCSSRPNRGAVTTRTPSTAISQVPQLSQR